MWLCPWLLFFSSRGRDPYQYTCVRNRPVCRSDTCVWDVLSKAEQQNPCTFRGLIRKYLVGVTSTLALSGSCCNLTVQVRKLIDELRAAVQSYWGHGSMLAPLLQAKQEQECPMDASLCVAELPRKRSLLQDLICSRVCFNSLLWFNMLIKMSWLLLGNIICTSVNSEM